MPIAASDIAITENVPSSNESSRGLTSEAATKSPIVCKE
jgi:hypothetical protein